MGSRSSGLLFGLGLVQSLADIETQRNVIPARVRPSVVPEPPDFREDRTETQISDESEQR